MKRRSEKGKGDEKEKGTHLIEFAGGHDLCV
jgi:hypothetical protein